MEVIKGNLLTLIAVFAVVSGWAQTQSELTAQAKDRYLESEKIMSTTLSEIGKTYQHDSVFLKNLAAAQDQWVKLRQLEVAARFPEREPGYYGSAHRMCLNIYLTELNNERIAHLRKWLEGDSDGDVCAGSVMESR